MIRHSLTLLVALMIATSAQAVPVTFLLTPPAETTTDAQIYLAGNFQNWQPGDPNWRLQPTGDGRFTITTDFPLRQGLQFKFTLGSWLTVEKSAAGGEIANRLHVVAGSDTLHLTVAKWADGKPVDRPHTITGQVRTWSLPEFLDGRRIWVYLPAAYDREPQRRFPVLYMFDGQNVFDDATSFVGEWQVDETLTRLEASGQARPLIVVAVDNGGDLRTEEYTPWPAAKYRPSGKGRAHLQQWLDVLLPAVNTRYRTLTGAQNTGLAGSSLGGLMSLYGGFAHPDVFGRIGVFSPTLHITDGKLFAFCADQPNYPLSVYLDMGTREEGNLRDDNRDGTDDSIEALRRMEEVMLSRGLLGGWDLLVVEDEGGLHNEQAWSRRFPAAVEFLFPAD